MQILEEHLGMRFQFKCAPSIRQISEFMQAFVFVYKVLYGGLMRGRAILPHSLINQATGARCLKMERRAVMKRRKFSILGNKSRHSSPDIPHPESCRAFICRLCRLQVFTLRRRLINLVEHLSSETAPDVGGESTSTEASHH